MDNLVTEQEQEQEQESVSMPRCPLCHCEGLHACMGTPMKPWTQEEKDELNRVLSEFTAGSNIQIY